MKRKRGWHESKSFEKGGSRSSTEIEDEIDNEEGMFWLTRLFLDTGAETEASESASEPRSGKAATATATTTIELSAEAIYPQNDLMA